MENIKGKIINEILLKFPFSERIIISNALNELFNIIPESLYPYFTERNGPSQLPLKLKEIYEIEEIGDIEKQKTWELIGLWFRNYEKRYYEATQIFISLYYYLCEYQEKFKKWISKATPLTWLSDCFNLLNYNELSMKFLMMSLIKDSINGKGNVSPNQTGTYYRLVWEKGMLDKTFRMYTKLFYEEYKKNNEFGKFPEWILNQISNEYISKAPSSNEALIYIINPIYADFLLSKTNSKSGDLSGKALEYLASYFMSSMPGVNTKKVKTYSTDYDIVCNMDGFQIDFRSEFGRYFICECKDLKSDPVGFTDFAKFCRVLDSIKSKFGILFSMNGISGSGKTINAEREQVKVFQDRGIIIVVIDKNDIKKIIEGSNFIILLKKKYEEIRLDFKN